MKTLAILLAATLIPGAAIAAPIQPTSATASSSYPGYDVSFAIDQGGNSANTDWSSFGDGPRATLNLDLGGRYLLNSASVIDRVTSGGGNGAFVGGTTDFTTSFSLAYYADATFSGPALATYTFSRPTPTSPTTPASFAFTAPLGGSQKVEFVQYKVLAANGPNTGLSNISFNGSVPEPTTWAMMVLGFGMVGFGLRARRTAGRDLASA